MNLAVFPGTKNSLANPANPPLPCSGSLAPNVQRVSRTPGRPSSRPDRHASTGNPHQMRLALRPSAAGSRGRQSHDPPSRETADRTHAGCSRYTPPDCTRRRASLFDGASCARATRSTSADAGAANSLPRHLRRRHILEHRQHIVERQRRDVFGEQQRSTPRSTRVTCSAPCTSVVTSRASTRCASRFSGAAACASRQLVDRLARRGT